MTAYLLFCNSPDFTRCCHVACDGSFGFFDSTTNFTSSSYPVTDLIGNNTDDSYPRIRLVAFVDAVVEVAKVSRDALSRVNEILRITV